MKKRNFLLFVCLITNIIAYAQRTDFKEFLSHFYETANVSCEKTDYFAEIKAELHKKFLPIPLSPCSVEKTNDWRGAAKWETNDLIVVFAERYNDVACEEEGYPWMEKWLVSYDESGKVIDYILATKSSDRYFYEINGTISPTSISVKFANISKETMHNMPSDAKSIPCTIEFYDITMDNNGHFHRQKKQEDQKGLVVWNKGRNKFVINSEN